MDRLIKAGKIKPKGSDMISASRLGIGFEKLDRAIFDPYKAYDKVAATGVKWIRIQSGWARTEKEKGRYDFSWLDEIVDNLLKRSLKPWLCLCYGNGLYNEEANKYFGAVGCPPIFNDEQKNGWINYVKAVAERYRDKIEYYEIWNEPDCPHSWKHGANPEEYADFAIATAKAIKEVDGSLRVIGGALGGDKEFRELSYINTVLECGLYKYIDAITFHEYCHDEESAVERYEALRAVADRFDKNIEIIQGEAGTQSRRGGHGALYEGAWSEEKQAKHLSRHLMACLGTQMLFTSYFSCMDMIEALNGVVSDKGSYLDYAYFGILSAEFDENGVSTGTYSPKKSYYALQTIASLFCEEFTVRKLPMIFMGEYSPGIYENDINGTSLKKLGFTKPNGSAAFVYWNPVSIMTTSYEGTATMQFITDFDKIQIVDLITGYIYDIPEDMKEYKGACVTLRHIPVKDYPLAIVFGDFIN